MEKLGLTEKEEKFLQETDYRKKKIKKMMPIIVSILTILSIVYLVMAIRVGINRHIIQFFLDTGYTSLRPKAEIWYPGYVLMFWRLLIVSGFLFLIDIIMISFWYESVRNIELIKKLEKGLVD